MAALPCPSVAARHPLRAASLPDRAGHPASLVLPVRIRPHRASRLLPPPAHRCPSRDTADTDEADTGDGARAPPRPVATARRRGRSNTPASAGRGSPRDSSPARCTSGRGAHHRLWALHAAFRCTFSTGKASTLPPVRDRPTHRAVRSQRTQRHDEPAPSGSWQRTHRWRASSVSVIPRPPDRAAGRRRTHR